MTNKKKIINDPVHGFITVPSELIFDLINHSYFQRLRRIRQMGLAEFVYPGALHTRFHHALGAMHLMAVSLQTLRGKGNDISEAEFEAALIAILLHDIGHSAFSHALENTILNGVHHEQMSLFIMQALNQEFGGALSLAIDIFQNKYERKFFYQLVSSQLDMDRMDYLQRDSFFSGVREGSVGADRIIKMLDLRNDQIVVEEKGIYSIERFLTSRRLMYWQVYLHKTAVAAEQMIIKIMQRAKQLIQDGESVFSTPPLKVFLEQNIDFQEFSKDKKYLKSFVRLDDYDVWASIKTWTSHADTPLSELAKMLINRKLFRIYLNRDENEITTSLLPETEESIRNKLASHYKISAADTNSFFAKGAVSNAAYLSDKENIWILRKNGSLVDVAQASDLPNIAALSQIVRKYYVAFPKKEIFANWK